MGAARSAHGHGWPPQTYQWVVEELVLAVVLPEHEPALRVLAEGLHVAVHRQYILVVLQASLCGQTNGQSVILAQLAGVQVEMEIMSGALGVAWPGQSYRPPRLLSSLQCTCAYLRGPAVPTLVRVLMRLQA